MSTWAFEGNALMSKAKGESISRGSSRVENQTPE
jgi:hypothetical protein